MLIYCTLPNTWYLCLCKVSTIMLQFVFYHVAWNMVCESEGLVLHVLDVIYILGVPILKVRMLCYVHLTCQRTEIFLVCMWRHGGHVGGTLTKECLLASIVLGTNMAAMSLYFESPGIDCKPSIANLYTVVWTDRNCREIKRTFSSKCNGSHEFDFAFYYVFQPLLSNSCFPWPAKKKKHHIHVYIFILTSGSSALLGHPRCGLLIWPSLLAIIQYTFLSLCHFFHEPNKQKTNIREGCQYTWSYWSEAWNVSRGAKQQVSIWCSAEGARRWTWISVRDIYIFLFIYFDVMMDWIIG